MFTWRKLGKLFDPKDWPDNGWMYEFAQSPSALICDGFVRIYFCARPAPDAAGQYVSHLAYIDVDRRDPRRIVDICRAPLLPLGETGTFDEFGTNPVSVIRHGDEVRVYYAGWTRCESVPVNGAIGVAVSRDGGESFHRLGDGPVISYSPDEPFMMGSPRIRRYSDTWYLWYVAGKVWLPTAGRPEPVYKIRMASSADGIDWIKAGRDLLPDRLGDDECQACPDVIRRGDRYHMFYSYRHATNYRSREGGYRIGYAASDDLLHWQRQDELAGLKPSEGDGWDSQMACYPHVFDLDGETYMVYQGNDIGRSGIGIARLEAPRNWSRL